MEDMNLKERGKKDGQRLFLVWTVVSGWEADGQ